MLVLSRKMSDAVMVGGEVSVTVVGFSDRRVTLAVDGLKGIELSFHELHRNAADEVNYGEEISGVSRLIVQSHDGAMAVISLSVQEAVRFGAVGVVVTRIRAGRDCALGFDAPRDIRVLRRELPPEQLSAA